MQKRGQVTIFIILGIIIIVAIVFGISMRKQIAKAVAGTETLEALSFTEQSQMVKEHVEDCLKEALVDAVFNSNVGASPGITSFEDYYAQVAILVEDHAERCINLNQFRPLIIRRVNEMVVAVYGDIKIPPTKIAAEAKFKVHIEEGANTASFDTFTVTLPLKGGVYQPQ
ncbi:MAG: hypothetical protein QME12_04090 [Nanoarchaeota archaeon]|nr:hypothetical protein [Nanoarchaeota archaeon]